MAAITLVLLFPSVAAAQAQAEFGSTLTLKVDGLTSQERDAVQLQLNGREDLKLVFACVPAGILVFQGDAQSTRSITRQRTMTVMQERAASARLTELNNGLAEAETTCAEQRNR